MKTKYWFLSVLMLLGLLLPIAGTVFSQGTSPDIGKLADHVRETTAGFHDFGSIAYAGYGKLLELVQRPSSWQHGAAIRQWRFRRAL